MKKIELNTFGKGKVYVHLAEELNRLDDEQHKRVVGKTLTYLREHLACIKEDIDRGQKIFFYKLIKNDVIKSIDESVILKDTSVINFLKNAVNIILKTYSKENL